MSDLHLDCPGNEGWLGTLEARPDDALIVAGDAAVRLTCVAANSSDELSGIARVACCASSSSDE